MSFTSEYNRRLEKVEKTLINTYGVEYFNSTILPQMRTAAKRRGITDDDLASMDQREVTDLIGELIADGRHISMEENVAEHIRQAKTEEEAEALRAKERRRLEKMMKDPKYSGSIYERDEDYIEEVTNGFRALFPEEQESNAQRHRAGLLTGE
ncbi:MAG: hypothetical protein JXL84_09260 [Deltaproteobacteria bacterium]|nr:hypothetical protein [Deltaproteobacteria bacterium]